MAPVEGLIMAPDFHSLMDARNPIGEASAESVDFAVAPSQSSTERSAGRGLVIAAYVIGGFGFLIPFVFGPIALTLAAIAQGKRFDNALGALILAVVCTAWGGFVLYVGLSRGTLG